MQFDESMQFWRLADALEITQAALLIVGLNPGKCTFSDPDKPEHSNIRDENSRFVSNELVAKFQAAYHAIIKAIDRGKLESKWAYESGLDKPIAYSTVDVEELKQWLASRTPRPRFFFPGNEAPEFHNPNHPRYAPKLAAVVSAWEAVTKAEPNKTVKQTLITWLNKEAGKYGLLDDNNKPRKKSIEELATIANWEPTGGVPKTASKMLPMVKENKKDSLDVTHNGVDCEPDVPF